MIEGDERHSRCGPGLGRQDLPGPGGAPGANNPVLHDPLSGGEGKAQAAQRGRGDLLVVPARCSGAAG